MKHLCKKRRYMLLVLLLVFLLLVVWIVWGNVTVKTSVYEIGDSNIPKGLEGYRIAQISDLHNAEFGQNNEKLLTILRRESPDTIVFTGDFVDSSHTDLEVAISFAEQAAKIAPCYYVTGNHEAWLQEQYAVLEQRCKDCHVEVLHNETKTITVHDDSIQLIGIDDPDFVSSDSGILDIEKSIISTEIQKANSQKGYQILLSHRPEVFDVYAEHHINLALCGHAHGGQFRLPWIGGLIAPNQGWFPKYDSGIYQQDDTYMVVSRGIGNSIIPIRWNNRPEVVMVVLHQK